MRSDRPGNYLNIALAVERLQGLTGRIKDSDEESELISLVDGSTGREDYGIKAAW